jgi:hypothetical protein
LYIVTAIPERELMAGALQLRQHSAISHAGRPAVHDPPDLAAGAQHCAIAGQPGREAEAIRHFEFTQPIKLESSIKEVSELAQTMDRMKRTIHRFLEISHAVAAEQNFDRCCRGCSTTRSRHPVRVPASFISPKKDNSSRQRRSMRPGWHGLANYRS